MTPQSSAFYQRVLTSLNEARVPFLVGGAFALRHYTGIVRDTKDLDLFLLPRDQNRAMQVLESKDEKIEWTAPHWLTKVYRDRQYVDLIVGLANGMGQVTEGWWTRAPHGEMFGTPVLFVPVEEMIWSKAFIMERDRFDGADINHLIHAQWNHLDWNQLLTLFGPHWRVLLCHFILFGYVYPKDRDRIPSRYLSLLLERLINESPAGPDQERLCRGTLLSRTQYVEEVESGQFEDARVHPHGPLTARQAIQ